MNERKLTKSELAKREDIIMKMKDNKRALVQKYGKDAEAVMYGRATNLAKKKSEGMDQDKIKELVKDALQNPKKADLNKDGKLSDYEEKRGAAIEKSMVNESKEAGLDELKSIIDQASSLGEEARSIIEAYFPSYSAQGEAYGVFDFVESSNPYDTTLVTMVEEIEADEDSYEDEDLNEDLDLGHQDNEPHMLKADLYRIGKYAMELYQMVDDFEEGSEEVDFPHWWQSKIIRSKDALVGAKHYLDFEIKEPQIDAMVDVAAEEEVIDENALGMTDSRLSSDQHVELDYAVRDDSAYTFGNDPYADDQLRYKYAKKMGFLEEGLPKGYWDKKMDAEDEIDESYNTLVNKIKKQGQSEKAAKAIAGAVASYKAKGGGKGPTAKQKG